MRFVDGGPEVDVEWYFCPPGAQIFPDRHQFASLNWWKGDWDASDTSIGEVVGAPRLWSDGSLPAPYDGGRIAGTSSWFTSGCSGHPALVWAGDPAMPVQCMLTPPGPCLTNALANYDIVEFSIDGGTSWIAATHISGDHWRITAAISGFTWQLDSDCALATPAAQGLTVQKLTGSPVIGLYNASDYSSTYPNTWTYATSAGHPVDWPGTTIKVRVRCSNQLVSSQLTFGHTNGSLGITLGSGYKTGDSILVGVQQFGITQGGSIVVPTMPSGFTLLHSGTSNAVTWWYKPNAYPLTSVSATGLNLPDNSLMMLFGCRTRPSSSIAHSQYLDAQTAATSLITGSLSFTGPSSAMWALFRNQRQAASPVTVSTWSGPPSGWVIQGQHGTNDGLAPPYNMVSECAVGSVHKVAGTYQASITSSQSLVWSSAFLIPNN